jgi:hypothetical protein
LRGGMHSRRSWFQPLNGCKEQCKQQLMP